MGSTCSDLRVEELWEDRLSVSKKTKSELCLLGLLTKASFSYATGPPEAPTKPAAKTIPSSSTGTKSATLGPLLLWT
jgi:hypothetical protein